MNRATINQLLDYAEQTPGRKLIAAKRNGDFMVTSATNENGAPAIDTLGKDWVAIMFVDPVAVKRRWFDWFLPRSLRQREKAVNSIQLRYGKKMIGGGNG